MKHFAATDPVGWLEFELKRSRQNGETRWIKGLEFVLQYIENLESADQPVPDNEEAS